MLYQLHGIKKHILYIRRKRIINAYTLFVFYGYNSPNPTAFQGIKSQKSHAKKRGAKTPRKLFAAAGAG